VSAAGDLGEYLGIRQVEGSRDEVVVALDVQDHHLNPTGSLHGGAIATLIDIAMGRATDTTDDDAERPSTIEMKVNYLAPGERGTVTATARVRRRGRQFTVVEAEVTQGDEVLALAIGTYTTI